MDIPNDKLIDMYTGMLRIRLFEEKIAELNAQGLGILAHLYCGEEAIAVGACAALREDDYITSTHRGHGHCIAKGTDIKQMMAELFGKETGTNKGKGGSMHICDPSVGNLGANGIVAAGIPIATGAALSSKLRKSGQVAVCFFGDGATNQGAFHESLNMASIWKLPVVYVCENNQYGMGTPILQSTSVDDLSVRAKSYGIPGIKVDGMDVQSVYEAVNEAADNARKGYGPTLIVCNTYRFYGHFGFLPIASFTRGRTKEEINEWKKQDPIKTFKTRLIVNGVISERRADELFKSVKEEIEKAVQFAKESPDPAPEEALHDVYYEQGV